MSSVRALLSLYRIIYASGIIGGFLISLAGLWFGITTGYWVVLVAAGIALSALFVSLRRRVRELRACRHLPGPKPSFLLGNMGDLLAHGHGGRHRALHELHQTYGPVVRLHLAWGTRPLVSLSYVSPHLHRKELDSLRKADGTVLSRSLMGVPGGDLHRSHRQVLSPALTSRAVADRSRVLQEVSGRYVDRWRRGDGSHEALQSDLRDWSVHCLSAFLFGDDWEEPADWHGYHRALAAIEEEVSFRAFHPFFVRWIFPRRLLRVRAAYQEVAAVLGGVLRRRERRAAAGCPVHREPVDLLDRVARAPWSRKDRVEELMSLVLGGADPMSYVVSQALVMLSLDQEVQERARKAAEETEETGGHGADTGIAQSPDPYIRDIVHETLRLFPPVPFSAKLTEHQAVEEGGMAIPPRTVIMWMKNEVGRNPEIFREADRFNPDRFSAHGKENETVSNFLPFGAGPRHCVGNRLAEQQCATLLAQILKNFHIVPRTDVEVEFHSTISVVPSAVPVRLVAR
ncbi:cytochrome P450 [Streptomyces sp. NPDC001594]|uniref:cytochrome P450 n=1 Tax=Streptomyces sp. NPDC001594 TaxID=3364590 RepID=UPI0036A1A2B6